MSGTLAYLNGRFLPASEAALPLDDTGFVQGVAVTEQLRTFGGQLFRLPEHLARLWHSLEIVGIDPGISRAEMSGIARELAAHNHRLLAAGDDLGLAIFVTPGPYATVSNGRRAGPTIGLHTYLLPFSLWSDKYSTGQSLVTTTIEQVSPRCWPPQLKCRSRMHYYLADRQAQIIDPQARALLLDAAGSVCETATANLLMYRSGEGLVSPPQEQILPGISLAFLAELAAANNVPTVRRPFGIEELYSADEVLLTSTPSCLLSVTRLNGQPLGTGHAGDLYRRLLAAWSAAVGIDIAQQAQRFSAGR